jgi:hypothetical protein
MKETVDSSRLLNARQERERGKFYINERRDMLFLAICLVF